MGRWQGGRVVRWQVRRVVRWEGWEIPGLTQGWGTQSESKISSFCFRCYSRE